MKLFRKILFWSHLMVGVVGGLVILIMSVTGVLLTYERQIVAWADTRNCQIIRPSAATARLPIETLLAKAQESFPEANILTITEQAEATKPATIALAAGSGGGAGSRTFFVNPYTGQVLGEGSKTARDFFRLVTNWHRWLGANNTNRDTARALTGACNLGFLFIVISGIYLWWPRNRTGQQFKQVMWFRRGLPGKARDFNWHNVIGFWSFIPLFIVVLSAVVISYQWAGNLVYRAVGEPPPAPRGQGSPSQGSPGRQRGSERGDARQLLAGLNRLWARAEQQTSDWQSINLRLPDSANVPVVFTIDAGNGGQPHKRAQLAFDGKTGEVIRWEPFSSLSRGRQLRSILRFAHTGEIAGLVGQTVAGLVSLGGCFLVWTGLALAWRRWQAWLKKRSGSPVAASSGEFENA